MTHALRQNCGSFLYDDLRANWLTEEELRESERVLTDKELSKVAMTDPQGADRSRLASLQSVRAFEAAPPVESVISVKCAPRDWPLFNAPVLSSLRVTGCKDKGGTVFFSVMAILEGFKWTVEKTYDDFAVLHKELVQAYGVDKNLLPSRRIFGLFGSPKKSQLVEMQTKLEQMLMTIVQQFPLPPTEVLKFVEYPFTDVLSVTQALAKFFYDEGELVLSGNKAVQMSPVQLHCINKRLILPLASSETGKMKDDFGHLLDFLQNLKKIKVCPPSDETVSVADKLTFELHMLKSLEVLVVDSIEIHQLQGRAMLPGQIAALEVRRSIKSLKDVLVVYPPGDLDYLPPSPSRHSSVDLSRALKWTQLKHANFKLNSLKKIDESLKLLPCLEKLDLSYNFIEALDNLLDLPHLTVLDVSHNKISSLSSLHTKLGNVAKLGLGSNQIKSLEGMQKVYSLEYVDLSNNDIDDASEVRYLAALDCLDKLFLKGNPVAKSASYRSTVFSHLPNTSKQVALDSKKASGDEIEISQSISTPTGGHRRVPSRTQDITVDYEGEEMQDGDGHEDLQAGLGITTKLEEMRKVGGDKWLSIFNAEQHKEEESVTGGRSPRTKKKRTTKKHHRHHHHHHKKHKEREKSLSPEFDSLAGLSSSVQISDELTKLIETNQSQSIETTVNFQVTVLEYHGSLHSLSSNDIDQLLMNTPLEDCGVSVDSSLNRILEVLLSVGRTRSQRDLALLNDLRIHEGHRLAVCLQFSSHSGTPHWVVYCVKNQHTLAKLFITLRYACPRKKSLTPEASLALSEASVQNSLVESLGSSHSGSARGDGDTAIDFAEDATKIPNEVGDNLIVVSQLTEGIRIAQPRTDSTAAKTTLEPRGRAGTGTNSNSASTGPTPSHSSTHTPAGTPPPPQAASRSRTRTPSPPPPPVVAPVKERSVSRSPMQSQTQSTSTSRSQTPARSLNPVTVANDDLSFRLTVSQALESKKDAPRKSTFSSRSTPTGSHSPQKPATPRSKTPEPSMTHTVVSPAPPTNTPVHKERKKDNVAIAEAVALTQASTEKNDTHMGRSRRAIISSKPTKRRIVDKPGLESRNLNNFFQGIVAQDTTEQLMSVVWGGCNLSSAPDCELEVGVFVSDRAVYLLEVLDPEKHRRRALSWGSENLPLATIMSAPLVTMSKVTSGLFEQSILVEFIHKGVIKSFVFFPRTEKQFVAFTENLKAALDASSIQYDVTTMDEMTSISPQSDKIVFLNSDNCDLVKLKESLVWTKTRAQVGNFLASTMKEKTVNVSFDDEVRKVSEDVASKFDIVQYVFVNEITTDILPIANCKLHVKSRVVVLTNSTVYLCKEEIASWPKDTDSGYNPPYPRCIVLDAHSLESVKQISICDKAFPVASYTDPVYEFSIYFEVSDNLPSSKKSKYEWNLCVSDKEYIDQLLTCLKQLILDTATSITVQRTTDPIFSHLIESPKQRPRTTARSTSMTSGSQGIRSGDPAFIYSEILTNFATLTNYQRMKFFKKHVAQAEFMKSDEVPLSVFLAHCSFTDQNYTEIETCVLTSNYAIYLLSDLESIRIWLDGGGPSSFSRRSLLSKLDSDMARCFYRIWLNEIKEIKVGLFYFSVSITDSKPTPCKLLIHTENKSSTLSILSALSCNIDFHDSVEEQELTDLLSDYIDLAAETKTTKKMKKSAKPTVEFLQCHMEDIDKLKQILFGVGPRVSRDLSIEDCATSMHILHEQIMLVVEELQIRDTLTFKANPHLILLSNYGLYFCRSSNGEQCSPSVMTVSDLSTKKWCHIDLVEWVEVTSPAASMYSNHTITIYIRSQGPHMEVSTVCLLVQNAELLSQFVHFLRHIWHLRNGRYLPVQRK